MTRRAHETPASAAASSLGRRAFLKSTGGALVVVALSPLGITGASAPLPVAGAVPPASHGTALSAALLVSLTHMRDLVVRIRAADSRGALERDLAALGGLTQTLTTALSRRRLPAQLEPELAAARTLVEEHP